MSDDIGFVYLAVNNAMPGLVKIGYTRGDVESRMKELSAATGVPAPFECAYYCLVQNPVAVESHLHQCFANYRESGNREFFRTDWRTVQHTIEAMLNNARLNDHQTRRTADSAQLGEDQNAANTDKATKVFLVFLAVIGVVAFLAGGLGAVVGIAAFLLLVVLILQGVEKVFNPSSTFKKIAIMMALLFAFIGMVASESWFLLWFGILALVLWSMRDKFKSPNAFKKTAICITIAYVLVWVAATDFRAFLGLGLLALLFFVKTPKS